jgi:CRP/FNR family transcriptional regulator
MLNLIDNVLREGTAADDVAQVFGNLLAGLRGSMGKEQDGLFSSMLGLYAVLSHGVYEVSAESLTPAQLRPVERERFINFLRSHKEAQMRAVQCICQEYRFALQDACRIALAETVAARLGKLLLELAHQIGEHLDDGEFRFPLLLTHEEMASMTCTTRETVTRTLGQFRKDGWVSIEDSLVTLHQPEHLQALV